LYPPKASAPTAKSVSSIVTALEGIDESELPQMVPELKKLIKALKASNLSREDFNEISEQLASNKDVEQPRENTSPAPTAPTESTPSERDAESRGMKIPNEKRDKATDRNLAALRSALSDQIVRKVMRGDQPAPVVISLQRPHSHPRQVDRPSSATRLQRLNSANPPGKIVYREGGEQLNFESTTAKAKVFAVTAHARRVLPERSHRQVGQISQGSRVQAGVPNKENRVSSSSENSDRVQLDDATGEQAESKSATSSSTAQPAPIAASSTTASPRPQFSPQQPQQPYSGGQQQQQWQQQQQQYTSENQNGNYQPSNNNYYNYQQQQQPVCSSSILVANNHSKNNNTTIRPQLQELSQLEWLQNQSKPHLPQCCTIHLDMEPC
uniref:Uncharacterized protein n=1 Tax=Ditylenchus dipsaci TaxID=166011 RepID=A0A915EQC2_9BILA